MGDSAYIHGTAPEEQRRLSRLNELLNNAALQQIALRGGEKILDVGCGLAQLTRAMARVAGDSGRVIGIERSVEQLSLAKQIAASEGEENLVDLRQGSATALPLRREEWGCFDIVHTRFLLEHVPDPLEVVRMMVEAARPGGRIILQDDDHDVLRLWPEPPGFVELWNAYVRSYETLGNDAFIGRRLAQLLSSSGAGPVRNTWLFFGSCAGNPDFPDYATNLIGVLISARDTICATGLMKLDSFEQVISTLRRWAERPDAAIWYSVCYAEGIK